MEASSQLFSLKWNNYLSHIMDAFDSLRSEENLVDVTLSCEGYKIKAHKMLLSACSSYFKDLFKDNPCQHPIVVFRNVRFYDLKALIDFIYQGEVNVMQDQLSSFLATAKLLEVKGLADNNFSDDNDGPMNQDSENLDEDVSENMDDDDVEEEENLSDASQYTHQTVSQKDASCPLTIIPINKAPVPTLEPIHHKRRKKAVDEDEVFQQQQQHQQQQPRRFMPNLKPMLKNDNDLSSTLSFTTKQSVEIFPICNIKSEKSDDYDLKEYSSVHSPEQSLNEILPVEDNYQKTNIELNHLLSKAASTGGVQTSGDMSSDSLQGHWLSSLNNTGDGPEATTMTETNRKSAPSTVDFSQQRHRYICSICGATYKHLRNLRAHCHLHYGKTRCNLCNKVLCNISYFKKHLQQQHGLLTAKKTDGKAVASASPSPSPSTTLNS